MPIPFCRLVIALGIASFILLPFAYASTGDRNPTFQHCLRGCALTYCDPSQPPIAFYLRLFGWTCAENCAYQCSHSFTDNVRAGSRYHQCTFPLHLVGCRSLNKVVYGKWAFYRLGPFQEPFSIIMSLGNLWVNLQGVSAVRRRIRSENKLRKWLVTLGFVQVNTWIWSAVFHARGKYSWTRLKLIDYRQTLDGAPRLLFRNSHHRLHPAILYHPYLPLPNTPPYVPFPSSCLRGGHLTGPQPFQVHPLFSSGTVPIRLPHNVQPLPRAYP